MTVLQLTKNQGKRNRDHHHSLHKVKSARKGYMKSAAYNRECDQQCYGQHEDGAQHRPPVAYLMNNFLECSHSMDLLTVIDTTQKKGMFLFDRHPRLRTYLYKRLYSISVFTIIHQ